MSLLGSVQIIYSVGAEGKNQKCFYWFRKKGCANCIIGKYALTKFVHGPDILVSIFKQPQISCMQSKAKMTSARIVLNTNNEKGNDEMSVGVSFRIYLVFLWLGFSMEKTYLSPGRRKQ